MSHFRAILFDMDGLLLDTEKIALATFLETCRTFDLGEPGEAFLACIGTTAEGTRKILLQRLPALAPIYNRFQATWSGTYEKRLEAGDVPLKPGVRELLEFLKQGPFPIGVATSTATRRATLALREAGILPFFRTLTGGDQVTHGKPAPDIYLKAAESLGTRPEECLAFEDSANGVRSAVAAGMTVIQIPDLIPPTDDLRALGHTILPSLQAVPRSLFD